MEPCRAVAILCLVVVAGCGGRPTATTGPSPIGILRSSSTTSVAPAPSSVPRPDPTPAAVPCPAPGAIPSSDDPIGRPAAEAILDLFDRSPIVALGERHGWQAEHDLLAQVICNPRFPGVADTVVVEFGNRRLQPILDRYVAGEPVGTAELASVWRESTQRSGVWDHPVYARFFGLIRSVNAGLPADRRIRVLAGDAPIDYATITAFTDCSDADPSCYEHWIQARDESFADVVVSEVLRRGRHALLIAGSGHMIRRLDGERPPAIPQLVESAGLGKVFVIQPGEGFGERAARIDELLRSWPVPGLATVKGTAIGALDACLLEGPASGSDAPPCPTADGPRVEDVVDGYLLLAPVD